MGRCSRAVMQPSPKHYRVDSSSPVQNLDWHWQKPEFSPRGCGLLFLYRVLNWMRLCAAAPGAENNLPMPCWMNALRKPGAWCETRHWLSSPGATLRVMGQLPYGILPGGLD